MEEVLSLFTAARIGDAEGVRKALSLGATALDTNTVGMTPLMLAAKSFQLNTVELLLPLSNVNAQDRKGRTALMHALASADNPTIKKATKDNVLNALVNADGVDFTLCDEDGGCALSRAVDSGLAHTVKALMEKIPLKWKDDRGLNLLMLASGSGDPETLELVLRYNDPLAEDDRGRTALYYAIEADDLEAVKRLMPISDPLHTDSKGESAFDWAQEASREVSDYIEAYSRTKEERDDFDKTIEGKGRQRKIKKI